MLQLKRRVSNIIFVLSGVLTMEDLSFLFGLDTFDSVTASIATSGRA